MIKCELCDNHFTYSRDCRTTKTTCRSCLVNRHRFTLKWWCVQLKGGCCQLCGYDRSLNALDFHHMEDKAFSIGGKHNIPEDTLKTELKKTVLLCSNCHSEYHEAEQLKKYGRTEGDNIISDVQRLYDDGKLLDMPPFTRTYWRLKHLKYRHLYHDVNPSDPKFPDVLSALLREADERWRNNLGTSRADYYRNLKN